MLLRCWWCGDWKTCKIERTWHVGKDLQVKNIKTSVFLVWGQKLNASTTVNSWKRLQSHANTNRNASHVKMRMSQSPGRVAKLQTEMLEKRSNCAGSLRAAWPFFYTCLISAICPSIYLPICFSICFLSIYRSFYRPFLSIYLLYPTYRSILSHLPNLLI